MKVNSTSAAKESNPSRAVNHYISQTSGKVRTRGFLESSHTDTDGLIGAVPQISQKLSEIVALGWPAIAKML